MDLSLLLVVLDLLNDTGLWAEIAISFVIAVGRAEELVEVRILLVR